MVRILCKNNNVIKIFPSGTSLLDIYKALDLDMPFPPLAARVNNKVEGLMYRVFRNKDVEFLDITSRNGMRVYVSSITFVLVKAINDLFPGKKIRVENPISRGYYCRMDEEPTQDEIDSIRAAMLEIIEKDIPFKRVECHTKEAIELFESLGREDKVRLLETYNSLYTDYYKLDETIDYFFTPLLPSTGFLKLFELEKFKRGMLLRVPSRTTPVILEDKVPQNKLLERFRERLHWQTILGVETMGDFNKAVLLGYGTELVNLSEALQEKRVSQIADEIDEKGSRVVLIAGPSSSGKTTFSKRLSVQLMTCGLRPFAISLDDYFLNRTETPRDETGDYDFESIYSIDIDFFNKQLSAILKGEEVELPRYNFQTGEREFRGEKLKLASNMVLVIEGTHGLNPILTQQIPEEDKFRVYVSALTTIKMDQHNYISTSDNRMLRRILRDYQYRGYSAEETIRRWPSVRAGEEKWIFPYQENADVMFNSALLYELAVLRPKLEPLLRSVPKSKTEYSEAHRMLRFLEYVVSLPDEELPLTSVLREFLGGSSFKY